MLSHWKHSGSQWKHVVCHNGSGRRRGGFLRGPCVYTPASQKSPRAHGKARLAGKSSGMCSMCRCCKWRCAAVCICMCIVMQSWASAALAEVYVCVCRSGGSVRGW